MIAIGALLMRIKAPVLACASMRAPPTKLDASSSSHCHRRSPTSEFTAVRCGLVFCSRVTYRSNSKAWKVQEMFDFAIKAGLVDKPLA